MSSPLNKKHKRDEDNNTDTQTSTSTKTETETETSEQKDILLGGVELGGTTIRAVIARNTPTNVIFTKTIPTTTPHETLQQARQVFESQPVAAIGIGSFGPIDLDPTSKTYGYITSTPKLAWQNADVLSTFKSLGVPCGFTTDVNSAAMGEIAWGSHGNVRSCAYVTVGTGVGAGIVVRGEPITGLLHPEAGHMRVPRHPADTFAGSCPFHGDCLEGMASAGACAARFNLKPSDLPNLPDDHQLWEFVSWYLAQMCATLVLVISPEVIVLGGGVLQHKGLFEMIHDKTKHALNGYIQVPKITQSISTYIVPSRFDAAGSKTSAGQVGVLELSRVTYEKHQQQATTSTSTSTTTTPSQPSSKL